MRDLPWRRSGPPGRRDPYHVLLSEFMLQQTQVARVIDKFTLFLQRFPTLAHLAAAPVEDVLALWSGLGYYRRARLLHAAAQAIITDHAGRVPRDVETLRSIPGIGPYTAGAIASIAHGEPSPLVDGNVVRVLLRIEGRDGRASEKATTDWTWTRAASLVTAADRPGVFNEALMELGATVCTPKSPTCESCPLAKLCRAKMAGRQNQIPGPKAKAKRQPMAIACVVLRDVRGRLLLEERAHTGLWAGLWQPFSITSVAASKAAQRREVLAALREIGIPLEANALTHAADFAFHTSHREVEFRVYRTPSPISSAAATEAASAPRSTAVSKRRWVSPRQLHSVALSNAHKQVLASAGIVVTDAGPPPGRARR
jgi:A/G-specific adenine glycosylase